MTLIRNVRRHAVRLAEKLSGTVDLSRKLARRADDASLEVRYQLAFTIGSDDNVDRLSVLEKLIRRDPDDVWIQTAVQSSLADGAGHLFTALLDDAGFRSQAAAGFLRKLAAQIGQQNQDADIKLALASASRITRIGRCICLANPRRIVERSSSRRQRTFPTLQVRRIESCRRRSGEDDPCFHRHGGR